MVQFEYGFEQIQLQKLLQHRACGVGEQKVRGVWRNKEWSMDQIGIGSRQLQKLLSERALRVGEQNVRDV